MSSGKCPGAHGTGHPQTVHALAAVPHSSTKEPPTVNKPQLICCRIEPNTSEKSQFSKKTIYSLVWGIKTVQMTWNRAELAGARRRDAAIQSHEIYVHAHLEWYKMSVSSRNGGMATVSDISSEHQRSNAQRGLSKVKVGECLGGLFTSSLSPEVQEQEWVSSPFSGKAEFISFLFQN